MGHRVKLPERKWVLIYVYDRRGLSLSFIYHRTTSGYTTAGPTVQFFMEAMSVRLELLTIATTSSLIYQFGSHEGMSILIICSL